MKTFIVMLALVASAYAGVDVGIDTISGIPGTIDSGQTIVPGPVLSTSTGGGPGEVYFEILQRGAPIHRDSSAFPHLDPGAACTLALSGCVPSARESLEAVAWLHCEGDTYPQNDTFRQRFFVRVKDVAVTRIIMPQPDSVYDSGAVFNPRCRVWNFGNVSVTFDVRFRIGAYQSTRNTDLLPGGAKVVTAPDPYQAMPGIWACQASAVVIGDLHPENNVMTDTFMVRGNVVVDVAARAVLAPPGVIDTTMTITPKGRFGNNGVSPASFWAFFSIRSPGGAEIYAESSQVMLNPGDSTDIEYPTIRFSVLGIYTAICSTAMPGDQNSTNDVERRAFRVAPELLPGDIGVIEIFPPQSESGYVPTAVWRNYSDHWMTYDAFFFIHNKYGVRMYSQFSLGNELEGGEEDTLEFASFNAGNDSGGWAFCSTAAGGDTNPVNDTLRLTFHGFPGIEEAMNDERGTKSTATVLRGLLWLPEARGEKREARGELLDVQGRRVLALRPGANDVTRLAAGVYFVRVNSPAAGRRLPAVRKVVIQQ